MMLTWQPASTHVLFTLRGYIGPGDLYVAVGLSHDDRMVSVHCDTDTRTHKHTDRMTDRLTHARTHSHAHIHTNVHAQARTHKHAHTRTHACARARTHTHTHTHTHLYSTIYLSE